MKLRFLIIFLILTSLNQMNAQKWHLYSDSTLMYYKKNDLDKANYFIKLADKEIENSTIKKDTIYADFLYRKGIILIENKKFDENYLFTSLSIWSKSSRKNFNKIMKIHYFLGVGFQSIANYKEAYKFYKNCFDINIKHNIPINNNFTNAIYRLSYLDYNHNNNSEKAAEYSRLYIKINQENGIQNFDFNLAYSFSWLNDDKNYLNILIAFLKEYDKQNLKNEALLTNIYYALFTYQYKIKNLKEIIKYGEITLNQLNSLNNNKIEYYKDLYPKLIWAYHEIGDLNNTKKYEEIYERYLENKNEIDFNFILDKNLNLKQYESFKINFLSFESNFKKNKEYNKIVDIYNKYILNSADDTPLFSLQETLIKIDSLYSFNKLLTKKNIIKLDLLKAEVLLQKKEYISALIICNNNLNISDEYLLLEFYENKFWCEYSLNEYKSAQESALISYEILKKSSNELELRLLPFITRILNSDKFGTNKKSYDFIQKGIKIINQNNLENKQIAVSFYTSLGEFYRIKQNYGDALYYLEKSLEIQDSFDDIEELFNYYTCLINIIEIKTFAIKDNSTKIYEDKLYAFANEHPKYFKSILEQLYIKFADLKMKSAYVKSNPELLKESLKYFELYFQEVKLNSGDYNYFNYLFCKYLVDNDINNFQKLLTDYNKKFGETWRNEGIQTLNYLMNYRNGKIPESRDELYFATKKAIFQTSLNLKNLSELDAENEFKEISDAFEFLKNHLNTYDFKFVEQFVELDLVFMDFFHKNYEKILINNETENLINEFQRNVTSINKILENSSSENISIEKYKSRNREIEKMILDKNYNEKKSKINFNELLDKNNAIVKIVRINKQQKKYPINGFDILNSYTDSIQYGAIIIKKNTPVKFINIDKENQLENKYYLDFHNKIKNKINDSISYKLFFENIENELKGIETVFIIQEGVYSSINLESLYNPIKKQYLIEYLNINYVENLNSINKNKETIKKKSNLSAVLIGNPSFNFPLKYNNNSELETKPNQNDDIKRMFKYKVNVSQLPGTQIEIDKIKLILTEENFSIQTFSKELASEENLKSVRSPNILHIATHGFFLKHDTIIEVKNRIYKIFNKQYRDEPFLQSGLLLGGAQNTINGSIQPNLENGILTGEEAKSLNLRGTELVVLSACETGLGDFSTSKRVKSLQRAFMIAGAKSIIMSLWEVDDKSTQILMTLFYKNWIKNKMSKVEALKFAKIELKKIKPQPYYWAGFVLLE